MKDIWLNRFRKAAWPILGLLLLWGGVELIITLFGTSSMPQQHMVTTITQVVVPPPPPPPPPVTPPPPKMTQAPKEAMSPVKAPSAKPSPVPKPPGNPLTTDGAVGKDAFGLTGGNGGGDTIGGDGGGGGDPFGYFDGVLKDQVEAVLLRDPRARFGHYSIPVQVWLDSSGRIIRAQLVQSTGNVDLDKAVASDLRSILANAPMPQGMRQPVNIRINSQ